MKTQKIIHTLLIVLLLLSFVLYGFMAVMSAAGWLYNVREGNYPDIFRSFAQWMYAGTALLFAAVILVLLSSKSRFCYCALAAMPCAGLGLTACLSSLYRFCVYADQNFSGIGDTMQPVSELYRDRLLPLIFPAVLCFVLAAWHFWSEDARDFRNKKRAADDAPAPGILE